MVEDSARQTGRWWRGQCKNSYQIRDDSVRYWHWRHVASWSGAVGGGSPMASPFTTVGRGWARGGGWCEDDYVFT